MSKEVRAQYIEVDEKGKLRDVQDPSKEATRVVIENEKAKVAEKEEMEH